MNLVVLDCPIVLKYEWIRVWLVKQIETLQSKTIETLTCNWMRKSNDEGEESQWVHDSFICQIFVSFMVSDICEERERERERERLGKG